MPVAAYSHNVKLSAIFTEVGQFIGIIGMCNYDSEKAEKRTLHAFD